MISQTVANVVRDKILAKVDVEEGETNRVFVNSPYIYPDGDYSRFSITRDNNQWVLSDDGEVFSHAAYQGINLKDDRRKDRFKDILQSFGVEEVDRKLRIVVDGEEFGDAYFAFSQACMQLFDSGREVRASAVEEPRGYAQAAMGPKREPPQAVKVISEDLEPRIPIRQKVGMIARAVAPKLRWDFNWQDTHLDKLGLYVVDSHAKVDDRDILMFGIHDARQCSHAAHSTLFYKKNRLNVSSIAVVEKGRSLKEGSVKLLRDADTEIVDEQEVEKIRRIVLH